MSLEYWHQGVQLSLLLYPACGARQTPLDGSASGRQERGGEHDMPEPGRPPLIREWQCYPDHLSSSEIVTPQILSSASEHTLPDCQFISSSAISSPSRSSPIMLNKAAPPAIQRPEVSLPASPSFLTIFPVPSQLHPQSPYSLTASLTASPSPFIASLTASLQSHIASLKPPQSSLTTYPNLFTASPSVPHLSIPSAYHSLPKPSLISLPSPHPPHHCQHSALSHTPTPSPHPPHHSPTSKNLNAAQPPATSHQLSPYPKDSQPPDPKNPNPFSP
ncbi:uncharacterized protein LOC135104635 [Scylla paramamosain]|uniref:uncharacterized protein LOC135104635 n=1 Tax=Scylla paramamosain TaxID=85552 RepID=UPI003082D1D7